MNIKQMEAMLPDFSDEILKDFEKTQDNFKSITVQKGLQMLERRKMDTNTAKKTEFWQKLQKNLELNLKPFLNDLAMKKSNANKERKITEFFKYIDKNTNK
ncbi:hypothetical protein FNW52_02965 [Flavobacterium sp. ZT3R18]|uniref:hypothetical protein n=1 Tax=Flavobacterium sp. ZT3R18 TaxID=2594429 RepID=UPI001179C4D0|nr:hypothetical protein [Flavobacterium sp. ZT3R18]TRX37876.1 hypothetical protein FNW52_02965 [Flavobacterium sp. ZT3R18]